MKKKIIKIIYLFIHINISFFFGQSTISRFDKKIKLTTVEQNNWQHKDVFKDTIFGISLDKTYKELIKSKKGNNVIVAVLDTELDINHEDLKNAIWINKKEIPNNKIDDDKNGYVDDINGWNFLANKKGEAILYENYEATRIIRNFEKKYPKKNNIITFNGNLKDSLLYQKALIKKLKFADIF